MEHNIQVAYTLPSRLVDAKPFLILNFRKNNRVLLLLFKNNLKSKSNVIFQFKSFALKMLL